MELSKIYFRKVPKNDDRKQASEHSNDELNCSFHDLDELWISQTLAADYVSWQAWYDTKYVWRGGGAG